MNRFLNPRPGGWSRSFWISFAVGLLMIGSESLWIDEGQTWSFARQPSLADWVATLLSNHKSEAQMPLGMFVAWLGARFIGSGEWQLRSLNALWVGIAGVAIGRLGQALGRRELLPLFLAHPFVWYYANQARPYSLIICASAWLLFLWASLREKRPPVTALFWIAGAVAAIGLATSLLFAFALAGFGFAFGMTIRVRKIRLDRRHLLPVAVTAATVVALMAYYAWALNRGAGGAKIWRVGLSNAAFALYELLGFGGLGPPRHELRELARHQGGIAAVMLQGRYLATIPILAAVYLALVRPFWKLRRDSLSLMVSGTAAISAITLVGAAVAIGFPFWGRHLAFLLPLIVLLISRAAAETSPGFLRTPLVSLLILCLLASSLCQRFRSEYQRDDYRSASRLARGALDSGKTVWWVADHVTAAYYGLQARGEEPGPARLVLFNLENERETRNQPAPDMIFISKPDIHDPEGQVRSYVNERGYQPFAELTDFRVYARHREALDQ
jgi:hypothetical protein